MMHFIRTGLLENGVWTEWAVDKRQLSEFIRGLSPMHASLPMKRFGPAKDGGYVMPDDLEEVGGCISPGVSDECGFDREVADLGIDVHLADATVSGPPLSHPRFHFCRKHLDTFDSPETITIDNFCKTIAPGKDLILQMDIEGAEYRVLNSASDELLSRFRIMLIEFHDLGHLFSKFGFQEIGAVFRRLLRTHNVVHIHPNNLAHIVSSGLIVIPEVMEFTFLRKDRGEFEYRPLSFPCDLDARNVLDRPDVVLPDCWRR